MNTNLPAVCWFYFYLLFLFVMFIAVMLQMCTYYFLWFFLEVEACFRYRRDTDLLNSARAKLCASEGDLTKIYQASDHDDMMDVLKDLRSTKSTLPETLPSSFPPSFFNKYEGDAMQNPILAGIFPNEKINRIRCSACFTDFTKTNQPQAVERFVDKKPVTIQNPILSGIFQDEKTNRIRCSASFTDFTKTTQSETVEGFVDKKTVKDNKHGNLKQKFKKFTSFSNLKTLLHH